MTEREKKDFNSWAAQWLALVKPSVKGNTFAASYRNPVENHIIPYFGKKTLDEIKQCDVQEYINILAGKYSFDTVKKHKSCLIQLFDTAIENDYCIKNPARKLKMPKTKERIEKSIYTEEQTELVFNYAYLHRFGAEIQFMLETGVSRGELLAIRWNDVDFNKRAVYIRQAVAIVLNNSTGKQEIVISEPKNKFRKRGIPISCTLCEILIRLPIKSEYVFCNVQGNISSPRTWARRHFDVFMDDMHRYYLKQGIDIPAVKSHQLRHTRASILVNSGKNIHAAAKLLGHADLDMLHKRYVHADIDVIREQLQIK